VGAAGRRGREAAVWRPGFRRCGFETALAGLLNHRASHQAVLERENHELDPVAEGELREDAADVRLHRRLAQVLASRDLGVAEAAGGEQENLTLPRGQLPESGRRRRAVRASRSARTAPASRRARSRGCRRARRGWPRAGTRRPCLSARSRWRRCDGPRRRLVEVEGGEHDDSRARLPACGRRPATASSANPADRAMSIASCRGVNHPPDVHGGPRTGRFGVSGPAR
jgi:hypothetical protein